MTCPVNQVAIDAASDAVAPRRLSLVEASAASGGSARHGELTARVGAGSEGQARPLSALLAPVPAEVCNAVVKEHMLPRFLLTSRPFAEADRAEAAETLRSHRAGKGRAAAPGDAQPWGGFGSPKHRSNSPLELRRGSQAVARSYDDLEL